MGEEFKRLAIKKKPKSIATLSCRPLYTLKTERIALKSVGARWALRVLSPEWTPLINRSLAVRKGNSKEDDKTFTATVLHDSSLML